MIGDDISVTVLGVKGNQVRIGVHAPNDVGIHREEIYARVRKEKASAAPRSGAEVSADPQYA